MLHLGKEKPILRDVELILAERGIGVTHESIRQ